MYDFDYHRPSTLGEAETLMARLPGAKILGGGHTLLPTLKLRLAQPSDLVDLGRIEGLSGVVETEGAITVRAMTTHREVSENEVVISRIPALAELAGGIGDPQVRHRGTIGGSVANNDPAADYPAACLGLGATIETDRRKIEAGSYFKGLFQTALEDDEIILSISFPVPEMAAYVKFPNPASRYALVGVFVARTGGDVRVAITGAGSSGVFRDTVIEEALRADFAPERITESGMAEDGLATDMHASAEYRRHLIAVLARRCVASARGRPG